MEGGRWQEGGGRRVRFYVVSANVWFWLVVLAGGSPMICPGLQRPPSKCSATSFLLFTILVDIDWSIHPSREERGANGHRSLSTYPRVRNKRERERERVGGEDEGHGTSIALHFHFHFQFQQSSDLVAHAMCRLMHGAMNGIMY